MGMTKSFGIIILMFDFYKYGYQFFEASYVVCIFSIFFQDKMQNAKCKTSSEPYVCIFSKFFQDKRYLEPFNLKRAFTTPIQTSRETPQPCWRASSPTLRRKIPPSHLLV